jgi:protein-S-isoprenylcysteine O-methyltransferase Ste14
MDSSVAIFGPLDTYLAPVLIYVILALVVVNLASRALEYRQITDQADEGEEDEAVSRNAVRVITNFLLVIVAFYFMTIDRHTGMVFSLFAVGVFLADFFEFEARRVEARQGWPIERPWGSIGGSLLILAYVVYQILATVFPFWNAVI